MAEGRGADTHRRVPKQAMSQHGVLRVPVLPPRLLLGPEVQLGVSLAHCQRLKQLYLDCAYTSGKDADSALCSHMHSRRVMVVILR